MPPIRIAFTVEIFVMLVNYAQNFFAYLHALQGIAAVFGMAFYFRPLLLGERSGLIDHVPAQISFSQIVQKAAEAGLNQSLFVVAEYAAGMGFTHVELTPGEAHVKLVTFPL